MSKKGEKAEESNLPLIPPIAVGEKDADVRLVVKARDRVKTVTERIAQYFPSQNNDVCLALKPTKPNNQNQNEHQSETENENQEEPNEEDEELFHYCSKLAIGTLPHHGGLPVFKLSGTFPAPLHACKKFFSRPSLYLSKELNPELEKHAKLSTLSPERAKLNQCDHILYTYFAANVDDENIARIKRIDSVDFTLLSNNALFSLPSKQAQKEEPPKEEETVVYFTTMSAFFNQVKPTAGTTRIQNYISHLIMSSKNEDETEFVFYTCVKIDNDVNMHLLEESYCLGLIDRYNRFGEQLKDYNKQD